MLNTDGHIDTAHRLLTAAIGGADHGHDAGDAALISALWTLALVCFMGGRPELWDPFHAALARLSPEPPAELALTIDLFADPARTGVAALPRLEAALRTVHYEVDPDVIENVAGAAMYADRLAEVREPLWRSVLRGREGGLGRRHLVALMDLCTDDFHRGEWGEAAELAAEGLSVSEERGGRFFAWYFRYHQALLAAVEGRFDASQELAGQIIGWAGPRGARTPQVFAHHALVLADLGQGDYESAYQHATWMSPAGTLASHVPHCLWVVMDLVEAAVRTHRQAEADRHVRAMHEADIAALSPRLAILAAASAAIAAADGRSVSLFEQALSLPTVGQWPFDVARVRLAYGERLRRAPGRCRVQDSPPGRARRLPETGRGALDCPRRAGAAGDRTDQGAVWRSGRCRPDPAGTADRPPGRVGHDQQADRSTALPVPPDRWRSPVPDLPQAGHHVAGRPPRRTRVGRRLLGPNESFDSRCRRTGHDRLAARSHGPS